MQLMSGTFQKLPLFPCTKYPILIKAREVGRRVAPHFSYTIASKSWLSNSHFLTQPLTMKMIFNFHGLAEQDLAVDGDSVKVLYKGCFNDNADRALRDGYFHDAEMTLEKCIQLCDGKFYVSTVQWCLQNCINPDRNQYHRWFLL